MYHSNFFSLSVHILENQAFKYLIIGSVESEIVHTVRHGRTHNQPMDNLNTPRPIIKRRHPFADPHDVVQLFYVFDHDWDADQGALRLSNCAITLILCSGIWTYDVL